MEIAFDEFLPDALVREQNRRPWRDGDPPLPALYISHGAPPLFEDRAWIDELSAWADRLPAPRAILIVSAHWETAPPSLSAASPAGLVYDFGGFDPRYYRMRYDTPDATALARAVVASLSGVGVHQHASRGLDHGAWVPLKVMYPGAEIPVLQLSMPTADPAELLRLGSRLRSLREHGVLVIGSGFMTHGLPFLTTDMVRTGTVPGWSREFDAWADEALASGDLDELSAFRDHAPGMPYAHPSVEHFTPLFVTLGAATADITTAIDGFFWGLSKRSLQVA
jgi:4,5-DOPA dioxygenase extradiol